MEKGSKQLPVSHKHQLNQVCGVRSDFSVFPIINPLPTSKKNVAPPPVCQNLIDFLNLI